SDINLIKRNVGFISARIKSGDVESQGRLPDIGDLLPLLNVAGAAFGLEEAFAVGSFVREGRAVLRWLNNPELCASADNGSVIEQIEHEVFRVLDNSGKVRDLPELREIESRIAVITKELQHLSLSYANNEGTRRMLQSGVPSQRDGRIVIALKHQFKGRIRGIVHEVSSSGQTLFIEPDDIVEKNNELIIARQIFDAELRRILREMTMNIAANKEQLFSFHEHVIFIETLRARAHYSNDTKGVLLLQDEGAQDNDIILKQARHPLLGSKVVPIDMLMTKRVLVISGPNTGGKTAALKTVGLFALMNQFGLALPLAEGSVLPVFSGVFADIGDGQSLEYSLSTFSAHIGAIASILKNASASALILLDELCAGTDPAEGGAIAMAILDKVLEENCFCIVTTHHGALKNYAFSNNRVENASMEFDPVTLRPSYRIVMGLPGESKGIETALHCGLPAEIINNARNYLKEERGDVSALIAGLKEKHKAAEENLREIASERKYISEKRHSVDLYDLRLRQKEAELKTNLLCDLRCLLDESRKTLENLVRELKEREITRNETLKVKDFLLKLEKATRHEYAELEAMKNDITEQEKAIVNDEADATIVSDGVIKPGVNVLAGTKKLHGLVRRPVKKGVWMVEVGTVSMTFPENDLIPVQTMQQSQNATPAHIDYVFQARAIAPELNIRGMRLHDAIDVLRQYIDTSLTSGLREFAVIHGKGDGILKQGVHDYLKTCDIVECYHVSRPELGGFGRTEVTLKQ
ncbi:MAG: Smr/MutS family protein, partial [Spirochaetaceae bacterium]|nr:Smr/MutS family protein [Spirochaetaceae bacterium]